MKEIYRAGDLTEAHILRGILEEAGIQVVIRGESLGPLSGAVPFSETKPSVWVVDDEDEESAMAILHEYQEKATALVDGNPWTCSCGEVIEPQFTDCWSCGSSRSGPYR
jgi:hypothetical protein